MTDAERAPGTAPSDADRSRESGTSVEAPTQAVIRRVVGRGSGRGFPELNEVTLEKADGSLIEARIPPPNGEGVSYQILPVRVELQDFGECPICLTPDSGSREHVPPHEIGGTVLTYTCERCNNEFGSRYEPHLQTWYEYSLGRVAISGGDVRGHRSAGEFLVRETTDGQFMLFQVGRAAPEMRQILEAGQFDISYQAADMNAAHIAAIKSAYLAACLIVGEVPRTTVATKIRTELARAVGRPRGDRHRMSQRMQAIKLGRACVPPAPGEIVLLEDAEGNHAIGFNRVFAVDWPIDPIDVQLGAFGQPRPSFRS